MNYEFEMLSKDKNSNKTVFVFDFDGTLAEARWCIGGLSEHTRVPDGLLTVHLMKNPYDNLKFIPSMTTLVQNLYNNGKNVRVLTHIHSGIEQMRKVDLLKDQFEKFNPYDCMGVVAQEHKLNVLAHLSTQFETVIYVDDDLQFLFKVEKELPNIKCFHTSSMFV